jgi:formamidopyrimidine-DNA glycosylase
VPELIEVERYRALAGGALGRVIASVDSPDPWFLKGPVTAGTLRGILVGNRFVGARRIGKLLLLDVDVGPVVGVRFGMTGTLRVDGDDAVGRLLHAPTRSDPAWDRWSVSFVDGGRLAVHDPRRLGGVSLDPDVRGLGPDASSIGVASLSAALAGTAVPLKARLLDQSRLAGVGNLLADEVLWRAGLSPLRPAGSLATAEVRRLHRHLHRTLADLTERGGSHLGDLMEERHPGGICPKDGSPLSRSTVGGRTTWWCASHQRGPVR